ncbi:hypothetical protein Ab1vBOLIVR4_gp64 [Agrobacterium phage OLIVR4]|nr:hypothetical protein Ab1vBOLIVR4_gp64 [Agrobacterium phage OLIVR4]
MSRIEITHNETPLSRELYVFDHQPGYFGSFGTRLLKYSKQERETTRHKFKGNAWNSDDERKPFGSQLDRPSEIPAEVLEKLKAALIDEVLSMPLYFGWFNDKHVYKDNLK